MVSPSHRTAGTDRRAWTPRWSEPLHGARYTTSTDVTRRESLAASRPGAAGCFLVSVREWVTGSGVWRLCSDRIAGSIAGLPGGIGGCSTSSSQGRESCLLLCSCSMLLAAAARRRRCRSFTPEGRPGTRGNATRLTRRRSMRSSRSCATLTTLGTQSPQRVDCRALACRATDQRGALAQRDRSGGTPRVDLRQARQERSPPPGRDGRVGMVSARTMAV